MNSLPSKWDTRWFLWYGSGIWWTGAKFYCVEKAMMMGMNRAHYFGQGRARDSKRRRLDL